MVQPDLRTIRFRSSLLLSGLLALASFTATAQQDDALLDRWIASQTNSQTWSAELIQTRSIKTLSQPLVSKGKVWIAVPNRFRWELGQPAQTIALRQPDQMLIIYPRLKRVEKYPLKEAQPGPWKDTLALIEAAFPRSRAELESQFHIVSFTESNGVACLALQPKSGMARKFVTELQISFRSGDCSPVSTALSFTDGSGMRNEFTNAVANPSLPDDLFAPKLDPDFTVVEPMKP